MIEIDLARQHHGSSVGFKKSSWLVRWLVGGIVFLGVGVTSWWWTQSLQQQVDALVQEKMVKTQSLVRMQERLKILEGYDDKKKLLMTSIEGISSQEKEKNWAVTLLNGVSRSVNGLDIWLDRVQLEAQIVELHGKSLRIEAIGKFIEALEHDQVIKSLPVVEILDRPEGESEAFPFMIRFVFNPKVAT